MATQLIAGIWRGIAALWIAMFATLIGLALPALIPGIVHWGGRRRPQHGVDRTHHVWPEATPTPAGVSSDSVERAELSDRLITALRRALTVLWFAMVVGLIGLVLYTRVASVLVIQGGSMAPAMPSGSLITISPQPPEEIQIGAVITAVADNGVAVTHRVTKVIDGEDGRSFELRGDANPAPDPVLVPARAVMGVVQSSVPNLGYVVALLGMPSGVLTLFSLLATIVVGIWLLEDLERERAAVAVERTVGGVSA